MAKASFKQMLEVVEVRGVMDVFAGRLACERIRKRTIDRLAQSLADQLRAIETDDAGAYMLSDNKFHGLIYEASGNSYLIELHDSITLRMLPVPVSPEMLIRPPHQSSAYLAHQQVVEGLAKRDRALVESAMGHHTKVIREYLKKQMRRETERKQMVRRMEKQLLPSPPVVIMRPRSSVKKVAGDQTQ